MEATRARGGHGRGRIERERRGSRETSQREESIAQAAERAMLARDWARGKCIANSQKEDYSIAKGKERRRTQLGQRKPTQSGTRSGSPGHSHEVERSQKPR